MFYLIGAGINDYADMPLKGLEYCKKCSFVFLEKYTSIFSDESVKKLEELIGKKIIIVGREDLENDFEILILEKAVKNDAALIVAGDPLAATTHIEFLRSCKERGVDYKVVHASSIYSGVCETGLHVYKFGKSCSIPFPEPNFNPTSFFDVITENHNIGAHTLVFLDIKQDLKKYMTINEGLKILLKISKDKGGFFDEDCEVIGIARLGSDNQVIKCGSVKELLNFDFSANPHVLIIPCMNDIEREYVANLYL
ncbi:diphthine synthase [archaeon CG06_land_8_20_14_3_00_37_11]|nr:MAG: diphthine synthase [archaeon CG06_land_8_20_14_3_00_37_11]